jgi:branched-chain amino acid transport system substrate-binding protein
VIHFGIASDPNVAKGEFNFIHWTPPSAENEALVRELQKRNIKRIGIFEVKQQGIAAIMEDLRNKIKGTDIQIVSDQAFSAGEKDFRSLILNMKKDNPEIILFETFSPELEILAKQIKEAGIKTPLTATEAFEYTDQINLFEGEWYVQAADATENFASAYKAKFGSEYKLGAPNVYDSFNLIVAAYEKIGKNSASKPDTTSIVNALTHIKDFNGALENLSIDSDGVVWSKAVARMIKDGKPVTITQ